MTRTTLQASVAKAIAFDGAHIDVSSAITGDYTIFLRITNLNCTSAVFEVEHSVDNFVTVLPGWRVCVSGKMESSTGDSKELKFHVKSQEWPYYAKSVGVAGGEIRVSLLAIEGGGSKTVTYQSWIESA